MDEPVKVKGQPDIVDDGRYDLDRCPYDNCNWQLEEMVTKWRGYWRNMHYPVPAHRTPYWLECAIYALNGWEQDKATDKKLENYLSDRIKKHG